MQIGLMFLWIIFFLIFLYLAIWHLRQANRNMPHVKMKQRPMQRQDSPITIKEMTFAGSDLDQPLKDFIDEFNQYVDAQNDSSRKAHRLTAFGYGLAAATSLISAMVVL
jgi:hypothetical protein